MWVPPLWPTTCLIDNLFYPTYYARPASAFCCSFWLSNSVWDDFPTHCNLIVRKIAYLDPFHFTASSGGWVWIQVLNKCCRTKPWYTLFWFVDFTWIFCLHDCMYLNQEHGSYSYYDYYSSNNIVIFVPLLAVAKVIYHLKGTSQLTNWNTQNA